MILLVGIIAVVVSIGHILVILELHKIHVDIQADVAKIVEILEKAGHREQT